MTNTVPLLVRSSTGGSRIPALPVNEAGEWPSTCPSCGQSIILITRSIDRDELNGQIRQVR